MLLIAFLHLFNASPMHFDAYSSEIAQTLFGLSLLKMNSYARILRFSFFMIILFYFSLFSFLENSCEKVVLTIKTTEGNL